MIRLVALLVLLVLAPMPARPDSERAGAFLLEHAGARQIGMGNASVAAVDDLPALYSNPAGLAPVSDYEGLVEVGRLPSHDLWLAASAAIPIQRRSTIAFGVRALDSNEEQGIARIGNQGRYRTYGVPVNESDILAEIGFGRFVNRSLSLGVAGRYLRFNASSAAFAGERFRAAYADLGIRYNSARRGMVFGFTLKNLGGRLQGNETGDLPKTAVLGFSWGRLRSTAHYINFSADAVKSEESAISFRAGLEYWWANLFGVRVGYDATDRQREGNPYRTGWRTGMSLKFQDAFFDLAFTPQATDRGMVAASLRFSLGEGKHRR